MTIGEGLMAFGEGQKAIRDNKAKTERQAQQDERQARQDLMKASQQEFANDISSRTIALREKEFNISQKEKQAKLLQDAEEEEKLELGLRAYDDISTAIRSNQGTKVIGQTNEALSGGGQDRIDIESNLNAFKSIENPTPEISKFITNMEQANKLGATSIASPEGLFKGVASPEARQSLFEAIDSIPMEQHTDLSASIGGILSEQDESGLGITTQTATATPQEQFQTIQEAFLNNPSIKYAPQAMRNELNSLAEKSIIDADTVERQRIEDQTAALAYERDKVEFDQLRQERVSELLDLNPGSDREFVTGEFELFPSISNVEFKGGSKEKVNKFIEEARLAQNQVFNANRIIEISDKLTAEGWFGSLSKIEQLTLQSEMNSIRSQMTGQNRVPITGPGVLTEVDMNMINDVLGAFDKVWATKIIPPEYNVFQKLNRSKLSSFTDRVKRDVITGGKVYNPQKLKTSKGKGTSVSDKYTVKQVQGS